LDKNDYFGDWMKLIVSVFALVLAGCGTLDQLVMLDTAPKDESQLRYPEWAENIPPSSQNAVEENETKQRKGDVDSLAQFLSSQGIAYEVISGGYVMIKLKQKVNFKVGSASISPVSKEWLNKLGIFLSDFSTVEVVINGHTDSSGGNTINDRLSQKRASEVKSQLINSSVQSNKIYTRGYGEYMPACTNGTRLGKACNRRVELTLILAEN